MKIRYLVIAATALFSTSLFAEPVALKCDFPENISFNVTLNEDANTATMRASAGGILDIHSVAFNPDVVNIVVNSRGKARLFDIDRTTLVITQNITFIKNVSYGQCELIEVPKDRKF